MISSSEVCAADPLLGNSVITSHLQDLGYPEKSLKSMIKCGVDSGFKMIKHCGCETKSIKPAKYSPEDRLGNYRRIYKKHDLENN